MLSLYYAPMSRSSRVLNLIEEMGISDKIELKQMDIVRSDGSGSADPQNPHPEKKVPALVHDGSMVTESGAVMQYLTDLFPETGLAPKIGDPKRGEYLAWMYWYGYVMEPALILQAAEITHPYMQKAIRGVPEATARIRAALDKGPWLLGDQFSAADILIHSPYAWFNNVPNDPLIQDWAKRCAERPARLRVLNREMAQMKKAA